MSTPTRTRPRLICDADADRDMWLEQRRYGITATDIAKIAGVHKYGTALEVYFDKIGDPFPDHVGEAAEIGLILEEPVTRMWCKRTGKHAIKSAFYANGDHDWMRATPDREVYPDPDTAGAIDQADGLLEVKTALGWTALDWGDNTVPDAYLFQVQWQLAVTGLDRAWLAALAGPELKSYEVERDQPLIDDLMTIAEKFLADHVAKRQPPAPDGSARLASLLSKRWEPDPDKVVVLPPSEYWPLRDQIRTAAAARKAAETQETEAKNALRLLLGDAEAAVIDGEIVATWRESQRAGYEVAPTTTRTLRFTKAGS